MKELQGKAEYTKERYQKAEKTFL